MHASRRSLFALALFVVAAPAARAEEVEPFASRAATGIEDLIWRHVFSDEAPTFEGEGDAVAQTEAAAPTAVAPGRVVTIVLTGDTGFSRNQSPVNAKGVQKDGRLQPFAEATSGIAELIDGDLNFTNIETVVTDRNDLGPDLKGQSGPFNFRSHPKAVAHLVERRFNLFSLANNHSMDYGVAGLAETLKHLKPLRAHGLLGYGGIGDNRAEAMRPETIDVGGGSIAFASIGIVTNNLARHRAGATTPGQIAYRFDDDFADVTNALVGTDAAYRILSIHYGIEGRVRADDLQKKEWRGIAVAEKGIDLVVGHHAHVVRGVERVGKGLVFYGLGNFLHHGTANMGGKGICKDYGLLARLHLVAGADGKLSARALEAYPLAGMHIRPVPLRGAEAAARIHALNYLGSLLGDAGADAEGVRFTPQADGHGLYCLPGADNDPDPVGALCTGYRAAPAIPDGLKGRIAASCAS